MRVVPEIKCDVPSAELLDRLAREALPLGLRESTVAREFHRDLYLDTSDRALEARGVRCRFRVRSDDRRILSLRVRETRGSGMATLSDEVYTAEVPEADAGGALAGASEPARRLRAFVDPARLQTRVELETERVLRTVKRGVIPRPVLEFAYDTVTVRHGEHTVQFREMKVRRLRRGEPSLDALADAIQTTFALRSILGTKLDRAEKRVRALESDALAREVQGSRRVTIVALENFRLAMVHEGNTMRLPVREGSGEEACRELMRDHLGSTEGQVRLLGTAPAVGARPLLEVWLVKGLRTGLSAESDAGRRWLHFDEVIDRVGSPVLRDPETLAALAVAARSDLLPERVAPASDVDVEPQVMPDAEVTTKERQVLTALQLPDLPQASLDTAQPVPDQFVNEQLSWLEFNSRVLALAEDPGTPLLARLLFLSIFSANLDEFFMVRIAVLKHAIAKGVTRTSLDGLTPQEELDAISIRLAPLIARQQRCFERACLPDLERHGVRIRRWADLAPDEQDALRSFFDQQVFPVLTPQAMTQAPGHPFPHLANLSLSLAIMVRDPGHGPVHFAHIRVPNGLPRFVPLPDTTEFVPIEEVIGANLQALYPGREIRNVHAFRITRSGDINIDEAGAADLLHAIEEEVKRRPFGSVTRIEVDARMPQVMRDLLLRELSFEEKEQVSTLTGSDIVDADVLVDLGGLKELVSLPLPDLSYPPFQGGAPLSAERTIFELVKEGDILVHHPYDRFDATVQRLIVEAADDPDVIAIKLTLYRSGSQSAIIDALTSAAAAGKDVSVFVELKARFDEERNIHWARKLERAGIHVVTGLVKLKTHAKTTLVVRREDGAVRRYAHVGTGNYNAATAKLYTDLGLLSCDEEIGADLNDLFNEFTGSSGPPQREFRQLLVAPKHMLPRFLAMIEAEAEHARAGRGGRIRAKLNGLADAEIIAALYRASQAGVEIDLVVRGICALRPGVPGLSERIRVYSILGRFLEHARIYHFGNGGDDRYFIGSADWRPRNLRKRVEVVTPVRDPAACRRLDEILELELDDPMAWRMRSDGGYVRQPAAVGVDCVSAQERFMERAEGSPGRE